MSKVRLSPEKIVLLVLLAMSILALAFMGHLVEAPKVLMGRSLTAIDPSLFPKLMIAALAVIIGLVLLMTFKDADRTLVSASAENELTDWSGVRKAVILFACMLFYALTMVPFGFLVSTLITMASISVLSGNRSVWQVALLATVAPILLYLTATRVLAVSLPELNVIELFYARVFGL